MSSRRAELGAPGIQRIAGHGGVAINVFDYGGQGPPLLLCHCTGTHARVWEPVIAQLHGFHVYAADARGHGDSAQPLEREAYAWEHSGRDLLALIDALGLGNGIFAAGHSAGGAHIAYAELLRPGAFAKVALIDAIIGPAAFFEGENMLAALSRRRRNTFESMEAARARLAGKPPMDAWAPEALEAYLAHGLRVKGDGQAELKLPGTTEAWMYELGGACDAFERLGEIACGALVVAGSGSNVAILPELQAQRLRHAAFHSMEGAGHFIPQERPAETAALLQAWFAPETAAATA